MQVRKSPGDATMTAKYYPLLVQRYPMTQGMKSMGLALYSDMFPRTTWKSCLATPQQKACLCPR